MCAAMGSRFVWTYVSEVVLIDLWPSNTWISSIGIPLLRHRVAQVCRVM